MNLAVVHSRAQIGIEAPLVTVEVHLQNGLPGLSLVGLPETAVKESKERVRSAIINSQFEFPNRRIIINLAPADLPKEGGRFDLAIAIGILVASKQIPATHLAQYEFTGELALSGELRGIHGILPLALATREAKRNLILPIMNAEEASLVSQLTILGAEHLLSVCAHLLGKSALKAFKTSFHFTTTNIADLSDIYGQAEAKRALEIAAAGGHNMLLIGPPGTGKTMLASRLPGIMPPLTETEAIAIASIRSISRVKNLAQHFYERPFRAPHHTSSAIALIGGGNHPKPGEISLAHHGVLFLDELPEFDRKALEVLREPLECGRVVITRVKQCIEFPAQFQLIAAMNPCPCGYLGSYSRNCQCTANQIQRYRHKISGPLLDRIDLQIEVNELPKGTLCMKSLSESSQDILKRVISARNIQYKRQGMTNSELQNKVLQLHCPLTKALQILLENACEKLQLSARSYYRTIKIARTIADLEESDSILATHVSEALSYRKLERFNH